MTKERSISKYKFNKSFTVVENNADGSCLFDSIAQFILNKEEFTTNQSFYLRQVLKKFYDTLKKLYFNPKFRQETMIDTIGNELPTVLANGSVIEHDIQSIIQLFLLDDAEDNHSKHILKPSTYGSGVDIKIFSYILGCNIYVVQELYANNQPVIRSQNFKCNNEEKDNYYKTMVVENSSPKSNRNIYLLYSKLKSADHYELLVLKSNKQAFQFKHN